MITIQLTEAEASRVFYAMLTEASQHHDEIHKLIQTGELSAPSGRLQIIRETAKSECLSIVRKIEDAS